MEEFRSMIEVTCNEEKKSQKFDPIFKKKFNLIANQKKKFKSSSLK